MTPPSRDRSGRPQSVGALSPLPLLLSVLLLVFGTNLQGVLLPILGHERGATMVAIALYSAAWSIGFVAACATIGGLLGRVGHLPALIWLAGLSASAAIMLGLFPNDAAWVPLRGLIGFCYGGLSTLLEGWLVERAGTGRAFAGYMLTTLVASLCGTLSLDAIDPAGWLPFLLTGAAIAASALPVALGRPAVPAMTEPFRPRLLALFRAAPASVIGACAVGLATGALGGLGPVFGMMSGLDMRGDTLMLAANSLGGALAAAPVGMLSERVDRRLLLAGASLLGIAVCISLAALTPVLGGGEIILLVGTFGFAQYPLYGLCVGLANEAVTDQSPTQIASGMLLLFGLGSIVGPLIGAPVMRHGAQHLFTLIALTLATLLGCVLVASVAPGRRLS